MAEYSANKVRAVAIELKEKALDAYMAINAVYAEIGGWTLHCDAARLPSPFDVRAALEGYEAAKSALQDLQLTDWKTEVLAAAYGDTLTQPPPCEADAPTGPGGIVFPTPGLLVPADGGLLIPADGGLTVSLGATIPADGGLTIPSATGDGITPPAPAPAPTPDVFRFEFFGPVVAGNTQSITIPALRVAEIELTTTSQASEYAVTFDARLNGVSVLLGGAYTREVSENYTLLPSTRRLPWNYWLVSPALAAGTLTVSITATNALVQHFLLKIIR